MVSRDIANTVDSRPHRIHQDSDFSQEGRRHVHCAQCPNTHSSVRVRAKSEGMLCKRPDIWASRIMLQAVSTHFTAKEAPTLRPLKATSSTPAISQGFENRNLHSRSDKGRQHMLMLVSSSSCTYHGPIHVFSPIPPVEPMQDIVKGMSRKELGMDNARRMLLEQRLSQLPTLRWVVLVRRHMR